MKNDSTFKIRYMEKEEGATIVESFLIDVFKIVHDKIMDVYRSQKKEILQIPPRTFINMIGANLVVNLTRSALNPNLPVDLRMEAMEETIDELSSIIRFVWETFEVVFAPEGTLQ